MPGYAELPKLRALKLQGLLAELKRRHVFRAAMSYALVGWILVQLSNAVIPAFEAPPWVLKTLFLFIAAGFPLVIVLAWAYELTPEGLRRTPDAENGASIDGRGIDSALTVALIGALLVTTVGGFTLQGRGMPSDLKTDFLGEPGELGNKLAIMPFVTVNADSDTAFLALGFSESLYQRLQGDDGISLVGMASTVRAAGEQLSREQVRDAFDVDFLVEGSVRVNDGRTDIFVQLVDTTSGNAVWSDQLQVHDGSVESVLIAAEAAIHEQLDLAHQTEPTFTGLPRQAFEEWLRCLGHLRRGDMKDLLAARTLAQGLVESVPEFGLAYAAIAVTLVPDNSLPAGMDFDEVRARIDGLAKEALSRAPSSPLAHAWLGRVNSQLAVWRGRDADRRRISREFDKALEDSPTSADLLTEYAEHKLTWGQMSDAITLAGRALKEDPFSSRARSVQINALLRSGKSDIANMEIEEMTGPVELRNLQLAHYKEDRARWTSALGMHDAGPDPINNVSFPLIRLLSEFTFDASPRDAGLTKAEHAVDEFWQDLFEQKSGDAYETAVSELNQGDPRAALLTAVLALRAKRYRDAGEIFSQHFADWLRDPGPLYGTPALAYAPWFAKAMLKTGRAEDARRLLDRHLAGIMVAEDEISEVELSLYYAMNFSVAEREADARLALQRVFDDSRRISQRE